MYSVLYSFARFMRIKNIAKMKAVNVIFNVSILVSSNHYELKKWETSQNQTENFTIYYNNNNFYDHYACFILSTQCTDCRNKHYVLDKPLVNCNKTFKYSYYVQFTLYNVVLIQECV